MIRPLNFSCKTNEAATLWINKDDLSRGKVSFYSQRTHVQFLLHSSSAAIDVLLRTKDAARTALQRAKDDEEALSSCISTIWSALSGKDCRVAQMLISWAICLRQFITSTTLRSESRVGGRVAVPAS
jgi:hypothetical protein